MLDIGWQEFLLLFVIAVVIIGPKELPGALRACGRWMGKLRRMARQFQDAVDDAAREADLEDVRNGINKARNLNVRHQIRKAVDPTGEIAREVDEAKAVTRRPPTARQADDPEPAPEPARESAPAPAPAAPSPAPSEQPAGDRDH